MFTYLFLCILPFLCALIFPEYAYNTKQKKRYLIFCAIVMIVVLGLRSRTVGSTDTNNYYRMMIRALAAPNWGAFYFDGGVEKGFQYFVFLLSRVFSDPQWILIVSSVIVVVCNLYSISQNTDNLPIAILMFVTLGLMTFEMQAMRQAIAMSLCLVAYEQVKKEKSIRFFIWVILASLFHRTAVVFLPVYFLRKLSLSTKDLLLFGTLAIVFLFSSTKVIGIANDLFDESYDVAVEHGGFVATAIYVLITVYAYCFCKQSLTDEKGRLAFYVLLTGMVCYVIRYIGALAAERVSFYFMFAQNIVLARAIEKESKANQIIMASVVFVLCILLFVYRMRSSDLVPYRFFTYA